MNIAKLILILVTFVTSAFAEWDGSAKKPQTGSITTPEELIWLLNNGCDNSNYTWTLKNDIVFGKDTASVSSKVWIRPDSSNCGLEYGGVLDGNNKTIYGFNSHQSLFPYLNGKVQSLTIANSRIGANDVDSVATLAVSSRGVVKDVEIRNTKVLAKKYAAGAVVNALFSIRYDENKKRLDDSLIVSRNIRVVGGSVESGIQAAGVFLEVGNPIVDIYNSSNVSVIDTSVVCNGLYGEKIGGGLVGYVTGEYANDENFVPSVMNSKNDGDVRVVSKCGNVNVGGVAGKSNGVFVNVENAGRVYGKTSELSVNAGGIVGNQGQTDISPFMSNRKLSNKGDIYGESDSCSYVGGIFAFSMGNAVDTAFNEGDVHGVATVAKETFTSVGGIAGYAQRMNVYGGFKRLGNWGNVKGESNSYVVVGGIIGNYDNMASYTSDALAEAFNYGDVTANITAKDKSKAKSYAAGITAYSLYALTNGVYNRGNIHGDSDMESSYVAGLMAYAVENVDKIIGGYNASKKIEGKHTAAIVAYAPLSRNDFVNCFNDGTVNSMGVLVDTASIGKNTYVQNNILQKTTKELQTDEIAFFLNSANPNDSISWIRRNTGYPCFAIDTTGGYSIPNSKAIYGWFGKKSIPSYINEDGYIFYIITNPDEFVWFAQNLDSLGVTDRNARLDNDLFFGKDSLSLSNFVIPMTKDTTVLNGIVRGNGHTIYGLRSSTPLFHKISANGLVIELNVANSIFEGADTIGSIAGLLSGRVVRSSVRNCSVKGVVAGGLVAVSDSVVGVISESKNVNTEVSGEMVGGIVGMNRVIISKCTNSGKITGVTHAGGIIGFHYGLLSIVDNLNQGSVEASGDGKIYAGGIAGYLKGGVVNFSSNMGKVLAKSNDDAAFAGGIVAFSETVPSENYTSIVEEVGNWGNVDASAPKNIYIGGVAGSMYAETNFLCVIDKSFNYGTVTVSGAGNAIVYAGGIVGGLHNAKTEGFYNRGNVQAGAASGYIGGVVGGSSGVYGYVLNGFNAANVVGGAPAIGKMFDTIRVDSLYYDKTFKTDSAEMFAMAMTTEEMSSSSFLAQLQSISRNQWTAGSLYPIFSFDPNDGGSIGAVGDGERVPYRIVKKTNPLMTRIKVSVNGRDVAVMNANFPIHVFDLQGNAVIRVNANKKDARFQIPTAGSYILKVGHETRRINVK